jgi:hypothetical protein
MKYFLAFKILKRATTQYLKYCWVRIENNNIDALILVIEKDYNHFAI